MSVDLSKYKNILGRLFYDYCRRVHYNLFYRYPSGYYYDRSISDGYNITLVIRNKYGDIKICI